jgi:hypothetical protein
MEPDGPVPLSYHSSTGSSPESYCDGFGASYATIFRIHGTSYTNVATQRSGTVLEFTTQRFSKYTV